MRPQYAKLVEARSSPFDRAFRYFSFDFWRRKKSTQILYPEVQNSESEVRERISVSHVVQLQFDIPIELFVLYGPFYNSILYTTHAYLCYFHIVQIQRVPFKSGISDLILNSHSHSQTLIADIFVWHLNDAEKKV